VNKSQWASTRGGRGAMALLVVSALLALWTLVHAIRIEPVPESPTPPFAGGNALASPAPVPDVDVGATVETDPFAPDRSAPEHSYRAPGEDGAETSPKPPVVEPVVLGTAVSDAAHSFATVQLGESHASIVRVGGRIGEYTIKSIEQGHVVFTTPSGKTLDIQELKP
jgi:hypothetical protein